MSERDVLPFSRGDNGVRNRVDGQGDAWANGHRAKLGSGDYIQDVDAFFGMQVFGHNTGERLFLEYEPDDYTNRLNTIRRFAVVAMFDRKSAPEVAYSHSNAVSLALYLYVCRVFAEAQPLPPKFFYVFGAADRGPWKMQEVDIFTGEHADDCLWVDSHDPSWRDVWNALGLGPLRAELSKWVRKAS